MTSDSALRPPTLTLNRRQLLQTSAAAAGALLAGDALLASQAPEDAAPVAQRLTKGWEYHRGDLGGLWELWRGKRASDNVAWQSVELPHSFNAYDAVDPDEHYYQGPGWYRLDLRIQNPYPNGRTLLRFEGAGQKTQVWVYEERVGKHVGGYDEFVVDLTEAAARVPKEYLDKGAAPLAVRCDNSRDLEMIPSDLSDFNLYGGLYRYVNLIYAPAVSLERVLIQPTVEPGGKASAVVRARLYNPGAASEQVALDIRVTGPGGEVVFSGARTLAPWNDDRQVAEFPIEAPKLWSPASPSLYRCAVTLKGPHGESRVEERFGLRYFEFVTHGPFKLNGERLLLRGSSRHEDFAGLADALTEDIIRREMQLAKEMGANFFRLGHYQNSRIALDLCDELGFLVWEEIPWCRGGIGGNRYKQQARDMLRNLIDQHYNHPAVIIWGLGNENDWPGDFEVFDQAGIRALMTELNALAHEQDPTRKTAIRRCDFSKDIVDVYSPSIWAGWYRGRYTEYKSSSEEEMKKVNHFFHAEWGGDSHARRHSEDPDRIIAKIATGGGTDERGLDYLLTGGQTRASSDGDWSETYICNLFDWHLKEQETMPWLTGAAQWIFKDFSTVLRPDNPVPRMNQKGVVERDLTPKEGYYVFQSYWAEKPMVHIYGHSWPIRWGAADEKKVVKVYSNCPEVELFVNGRLAGARKRNSQDFPAAGLRWMVDLAAGQNRLRAVGRKNGVEVADEIAFLYQTETWGKPARLTLAEISREGDSVTLEATLVDANGIRCLDSRDVLRFGLAGDGKLVDNLGTSTGSRVVQAYNGRAIIRMLRNAGTSTASVSSKGLATAFLAVA